jgi:hypothetical protein
MVRPGCATDATVSDSRCWLIILFGKANVVITMGSNLYMYRLRIDHTDLQIRLQRTKAGRI